MKPSQPQFATTDEVEVAFYTAFNRCDHEAMAKVWADDEVVCIHPGSHAIIGYEAVIRSWVHIFTNAALPEIQVEVIKRMATDKLAVHVVHERISTGETGASVLATNVYQKYAAGWLMVEHHGSVLVMQAEKRILQ